VIAIVQIKNISGDIRTSVFVSFCFVSSRGRQSRLKTNYGNLPEYTNLQFTISVSTVVFPVQHKLSD